VVNPMELGAGSWAACLKRDIKKLVDCDTIYLLRGWQNSKGARLERSVARRLGMHVIEEAQR
jgi:hypothetical protein